MIQVFTIYSVFFLATALVSFFIAFLAWQRRLVKGAIELTRLMISAGLWTFFVMFETAALTMQDKIFWSKIAYIGAVSTPVLYLIFVLRFTGKDKFISLKKSLSLFIIPVITMVFAITNDNHHLLWLGFSKISNETNIMEYYHGVWFWIGYMSYNYLLLLLATIFLFSFIIRHTKVFRLQGWVVFIAGLCPWIASVVYLTGSNPVAGLDLVPVSIILSGALMVYAILNIRFLDLAPVARETLVETLPDGILALDGQNRIQDINEAALTFLGIRDKNIIGSPIESSDAAVIPLLNAIIDNESVDQIEIVNNAGLSTFRIIKQAIKSMPNSRLFVIRDITDQVSWQREIREGESDIIKRDKLLVAIAEATALLVEIENIEDSINKSLEIIGKATEVNRVYIFQNHNEPGYKTPLMSMRYEWTDGSVEPQIDKPVSQGVPYEIACPRWYEILSNGKVIVGNIREFPESEEIVLSNHGIKSIFVSPVFINKSFWGFIGFDDSHKERSWTASEEQILSAATNTIGAAYLRKNNQDELIKAKEKAEESDRLKSSFLANMSHEIRTPMNGILGFIALLQEPNLTGEEKEEYVKIVKKSSERLLTTMHDIMDISKIESGLMPVLLSEVNINELTAILHSFFKREAETKGLQFFFTGGIVENLDMVKTDREKLNSILTNLIKNALKFTKKGYIEFGYTAKGDFIEFFVKDTGIGIPEIRRQAIFGRFVQADISHSRLYEGSGLGLAITKAYIEMLGGKIWMESEESYGSTFFFQIPFIHVKKTVESSTPPIKLITKHDRPLKILITEDDQVNYYFLRVILAKAGHKVMHTVTGGETIEICRQNPGIDVIIMDFKLPDMDGYEATREIRKFNAEIPIIALTAYAIEGDREKALEAGCNHYLSKPVKKEELMRALTCAVH
ncbi:MAG: histidine kinase N-terminal 7TM domain-containing protein [Bacteroidota bacterium]